MIAEAKRRSPIGFLQLHHPTAEINKRQDGITVEGVLRADFKDGHWVACDWSGKAIGDNIAMVQWTLPNATFPEAVYQLTGAQAEMPVRVASPRPGKPVDARRPSIPYERGRGAGRAYLRDQRGISESTIIAAEKTGMLRYLDNACVFTGRDQAKAIRSATLRHIEPVEFNGKIIKKRDLADSDKAYPAVLPGAGSRVVIVEGAVNALAVHDLAAAEGREPPTVIVSGGARVTRWLDNSAIRTLIEMADQVEIWGEHEIRHGTLDPVRQADGTAARDAMAAKVAEARHGELPTIVMPPDDVADAADWNLARQNRLLGYP